MSRKTYLLGLVLLLFSVCLASFAFAQEEKEQGMKPHCAFTWTFYSKYIWRGFELSKDSLVMFPSLTVGVDLGGNKGTFDFNVWGDFDTNYEGPTTGNNDTQWWETDWVFTYSNALKFACDTTLNYTLGWIYYDTDAGEDEELFVILGLDWPVLSRFVSPSVSIWKGIEWGPSTYVNLALSHSFALDNLGPKVKGWTFDLGGWVSYYDIDDANYNAFHDANIWAGFTIPVNDWCSLIPTINYTFPMSNEAQDYIKSASFNGEDSHYVYGGAALKISF